jgi:hypothetical protein
MKLDPRLANEMVLRLAAWRLHHGPRPLPDLGEEGLAALLQRAQALGLPSRDPWDVSGLQETSFTPLLREAMAWREAPEGEA